MTRGVFVESVIIRLGGGVLNEDMDVKRLDVLAYLPASVNYAMTAGRNTHLAQEGDRDFPSMFFGTFSNLTIDRTANIAKVTLPKGYVPMYGNEGLRSVYDNCNNYYAPLMEADRRMMKQVGSKMLDQGFYFPLGNDLQLWTPSPLIETINGEYIVRVEDLDDEDELPLAGDTLALALDHCFQWISDQRERPASLKTDLVDNANQI